MRHLELATLGIFFDLDRELSKTKSTDSCKTVDRAQQKRLHKDVGQTLSTAAALADDVRCFHEHLNALARSVGTKRIRML